MKSKTYFKDRNSETSVKRIIAYILFKLKDTITKIHSNNSKMVFYVNFNLLNY